MFGRLAYCSVKSIHFVASGSLSLKSAPYMIAPSVDSFTLLNETLYFLVEPADVKAGSRIQDQIPKHVHLQNPNATQRTLMLDFAGKSITFGTIPTNS